MLYRKCDSVPLKKISSWDGIALEERIISIQIFQWKMSDLCKYQPLMIEVMIHTFFWLDGKYLHLFHRIATYEFIHITDRKRQKKTFKNEFIDNIIRTSILSNAIPTFSENWSVIKGNL